VNSPLGAAGLVLDIAGAFALAQAFMFKGAKQQRVETDCYYDFNPTAVVSVAQQRADAWAGFGLLALGFLGQMDVALNWRVDWLNATYAIVAASALVGIALTALYLWFRPVAARSVIENRLRNEADTGDWYGFNQTVIGMSRVWGPGLDSPRLVTQQRSSAPCLLATGVGGELRNTLWLRRVRRRIF
jgi:hypothetical protein